MPMRMEVRNRQNPGEILGYLELAANEIPPETTELKLGTRPIAGHGADEATVPVEFRKANPDVGKWVAWADRADELDHAYGYVRTQRPT